MACHCHLCFDLCLERDPEVTRAGNDRAIDAQSRSLIVGILALVDVVVGAACVGENGEIT